jgi:hypothetical protein
MWTPTKHPTNVYFRVWNFHFQRDWVGFRTAERADVTDRYAIAAAMSSRDRHILIDAHRSCTYTTQAVFFFLQIL